MVTACIVATSAGAQDGGSALALRDAFLVAPVTAVPPLTAVSDSAETLVRAGWWAYYFHEPLRTNTGLTVVRPLANDSYWALSVIHNEPPCRGCSRWFLAAVEWQRPVTGLFAVRAAFGFGCPVVLNASSSTSVSVTLPVLVRNEHAYVGVFPGVALAGISTATVESRGVRPTLGAAAGVRGKQLDFGIGAQGVMLRTTAPVYGITISWHRSRGN